MAYRSHLPHGTRLLEVVSDGKPLHDTQGVSDLIGHALSEGANLVVIPMDVLDPKFFVLRSRFAGEMLQKFVTYGLRLAILGDHTELAANSKPLRDLIRGSNRGHSAWFLPGWDALYERLQSEAERA